MKPLVYLVFICLLIVLSVLLLWKNHEYKKTDTLKNYIESELRKEQAKRDSLDTVLGSVRDSLATAYILLANQKAETEHAKAEAQKQRRKYENITFKRFDNDTARLNAWSDLYHSLKHR